MADSITGLPRARPRFSGIAALLTLTAALMARPLHAACAENDQDTGHASQSTSKPKHSSHDKRVSAHTRLIDLFRHKYLIEHSRFVAGDNSGEGFFAPDWKGIGLTGKPVSRNRMLQLRLAGKDSVSTVEDATIQGRIVRVHIIVTTDTPLTATTDAPRHGSDRKTHHRRTWARRVDLWSTVNGVWLMKQSHVVEGRIYVDGRLVGHKYADRQKQ